MRIEGVATENAFAGAFAMHRRMRMITTAIHEGAAGQ